MTEPACFSTERMIAGPGTSAVRGRVAWAPARSLWLCGMTGLAVVFGPLEATPGAVLLCLAASLAAMGLGCSLGLHRLLAHRAFATAGWVEHGLAYLGTLAGAGGPLAVLRAHDLRDWAQRQAACHPMAAHRARPLRDYWWQQHCRLDLETPPRWAPAPEIAADRFLHVLEATWMAQQLPWAMVFWWLGGVPWLVWGVPVRIAACQTVFWMVAHRTHRAGPRAWTVEGAAVQGHDLPAAAWLTFGEAWHGNHHAWPGSARFGLKPGQADPGWWVLLGLRRLGLAWDLRQPGDLAPRPGLRPLAGPTTLR